MRTADLSVLEKFRRANGSEEGVQQLLTPVLHLEEVLVMLGDPPFPCGGLSLHPKSGIPHQSLGTIFA